METGPASKELKTVTDTHLACGALEPSRKKTGLRQHESAGFRALHQKGARQQKVALGTDSNGLVKKTEV